VSTTVVLDCTGSNLGKFALPAGALLAGYDTGSSGIAWTKAQYAAHPGTVRIDQDAAASDFTADILDVERGAATPAECARWYHRTLISYDSAARPGQRHPGIYVSASSVTTVVNALIAGGVTSGPGLWVANWNLSDPQAIAEVAAAAGPFPVIGVQWRDAGLFDVSVFSTAWLAVVSGTVAAPPPVVPPVAHQYPVPAGVVTAVRPNVTITWEPGTPLSPHWRVQVVRDAGGKPGSDAASEVTSMLTVLPHVSLTMPGPGKYWRRVQAAGDSPFTAWERFTA
jgi:hypothetical protein